VKGRQDDPRILIGIVAIAVGIFAIRSLSKIPVAVGSAAGAMTAPVQVAIAITVCLSMCAPALLRVRCTRSTLRRRVVLAVVPADEFDPEPESVLRFAAQLSRVDRRVRGWLDRPASAIRLKLEADSEGRLVYLIEAPERARELVHSALRVFDGVELRDAATALGRPAATAASGPLTVLRAELVLARPSVEPLARLTLDPDPLQAVAAAMRSLRAETGETASVAVDLLPAATLRRSRLRRRLEREARGLRSRRAALSQLLGRDDRNGRSEPVELAERRAEAKALDNKLKDGGPLFEAQVLVRCCAADKPRAKAVMRGLLASFEPMATARNWLRVSGIPIPGLGFLGSDLPVRRRSFDHRANTGLFRPARRGGIVSARECVGWLKPPTLRCIDENVLRSGALVSAPPPLDRFDGQKSLIPIGRVSTEDGDQIVGVRSAETFFSYIVGRSRYGKTELAVSQFIHLTRSGEGGLFIDPHADALERIKPYLTEPGVRERVVEINLSEGRAGDRQPGWNVLGVGGSAGAEARVEAVVDAFASALQWGERNSRALNITTQAAQALASIAAVLPEQLAPTIFQLPTFLSDDKWRRAALPFLRQPAQQFWLERFPRLAIEAITPVTNLVDRLRASSAITALLGQSQSTFSAREAMDRGLIVLFCPGSGGTRDRLTACLAVFDFLHAAKGRADIAPELRRPFWLFCDEVQTYDGAAGGNVAGLIEQTGKYGIRACLLNQNPERLSAETLNAVTTNSSHIQATALNARAAGLIAKEWGGRPNPAALTGLPRFRFLSQVTHSGEVSKPFSVHGLQAEDLFGPGEPDQVGELETAIDATAGRRPAREVLDELDNKDAEIRDALEQLLQAGGTADEGAAEPPAERGEFQVSGGSQ
jgi:hypothetical protein